MTNSTLPFPQPDEPGRDATQEILDYLDRIETKLDELLAKGSRKPGTFVGGRKHDEAYHTVLGFMRRTPIRLTAMVIAENTDLDNGLVGSRLRTLIDEGLVESQKPEGKTATFKITEKGQMVG